jgi:COMPASS component BRE2
VRLGWARREANLEAPVGFDAYSYGLRDVAGQKVHMSRPKNFFPLGEDIKEGDVIGLEINLPSLGMHRKVVEGHYNPAVDVNDDVEDHGVEAPDIVRDRIPVPYKNNIYFEQVEYQPTKDLEDLMNPSPLATSAASNGAAGPLPNPTHSLIPLRTLPNSSIKVYKNGKFVGEPFTDLLSFLPPASKPLAQPGAREGLDDGTLGYFPAVSVFRGGAAEVNLGPDFWYPPPESEDVEMVGTETKTRRIRAVCERYNDQIAEDITYDHVDEVDFWTRDGGVSQAKPSLNDPTRAASLGPAGPNVRGARALGEGGQQQLAELKQDDW